MFVYMALNLYAIIPNGGTLTSAGVRAKCTPIIIINEIRIGWAWFWRTNTLTNKKKSENENCISLCRKFENVLLSTRGLAFLIMSKTHTAYLFVCECSGWRNGMFTSCFFFSFLLILIVRLSLTQFSSRSLFQLEREHMAICDILCHGRHSTNANYNCLMRECIFTEIINDQFYNLILFIVSWMECRRIYFVLTLIYVWIDMKFWFYSLKICLM